MRGLIEVRLAVTHVALAFGALSTVSLPCRAQLSPSQRDSIEAQVQAALDSLTDAWRHVDIDGILRFYLDSALLNGGLVTPSEQRAGWDRVRSAMLRQEIGPFRPIQFDVLSPDVVVVGWVNLFRVIDTSGHAQPTMVASNTYVWVRRGGAWRILAAHESRRIAPDSVALPPPVTPGADSDRLGGLLKDVPELPVERVELKVQPSLMLETISAVTTDKHGNIYIIHRPSSGDPIVVLDPQGNFIRSWGRGLFTMPHGIRIDPDGNVWALDAHSSTIYKFTPEGRTLLEIRVGDVPDTTRTFCGATDIAFAKPGHIFVSDGYCNARVIEYDATGTKLREWGKHGTGPGEFKVVHSIALSPKGILYVADRENGRIERFDQRGQFLGQWQYDSALADPRPRAPGDTPADCGHTPVRGNVALAIMKSEC